MIRFQRPQLPPTAAIAAYYERAETARWYSNFGPCHAELVDRLETRLGEGAHVVPVANCTLGIALALRALTAGRAGDEVLVPSYTFAATAGAIDWAGLKPVFVDVSAEHWSLDEARLAEALAQRGDRVAAILACTTFGAPPPLATSDAWARLAADAGVPLVVDSASGLGALNALGEPAGHLGDVEIFSLHATKPFAIGEGGIVSVRDPAVAQAITKLSNFGFDDGVIDGPVGLNAKLAEWPAATALAVLDDFDAILAARRETAASIVARLRPAGFTFQSIDSTPTWQFVPALAPAGADRDRIVAEAAEGGVEIRTYFARPLHTMPAFAGCTCTDDLAVTSDLAARALSLPMANDLTVAEQDQIVRVASEALSQVAAR